jgi:rRNA processing protein Krr1/Pno1
MVDPKTPQVESTAPDTATETPAETPAVAPAEQPAATEANKSEAGTADDPSVAATGPELGKRTAEEDPSTPAAKAARTDGAPGDLNIAEYVAELGDLEFVTDKGDLTGDEDWKPSVNFLVPASSVGAVIGKSGVVIKSIMAHCNCQMEFQKRTDGVPFPNFQRVTIHGSLYQLLKGLHIVSRIVEETGKKSAGGSAEPYVLLLLLPQGSVGALIGKGGENIKKLQTETEAKVSVDKNGVAGQMQKVSISGSAVQRCHTAYAILKSLRDKCDIPKDSGRGLNMDGMQGGMQRNSGMSQMGGMNPMMAQRQRQAMMMQQQGMGGGRMMGGMGGMGGQQGMMQQRMMQQRMMQQQQQQQQMMMQRQGMGGGMSGSYGRGYGGYR